MLSAPADVTISCADDLYDPAVTGRAIFVGGSDVGYEDVRSDWDHCMGGMVTRRYMAEDDAGQQHTSEQTIYIKKSEKGQVTMPLSFCANRPGKLSDFSPDNLPEGQGYPTVRGGDGCGMAMYHNDEVTLLDDRKRVRIKRLWTVCDPCSDRPCQKHMQVIGAELHGAEAALLAREGALPEGVGGSFELLQNRPNPFSRSTVIGFVLPGESEITLTVQQADGRTVKTWKGVYPSGYHEVEYSLDGLQGQGVLYYTLTTDGHRATKRMVLVR